MSRTYTIEITANSLCNVDLALQQVRDAIREGYAAAPFNSDEEDNGYSFESEGEFVR